MPFFQVEERIEIEKGQGKESKRIEEMRKREKEEQTKRELEEDRRSKEGNSLPN